MPKPVTKAGNLGRTSDLVPSRHDETQKRRSARTGNSLLGIPKWDPVVYTSGAAAADGLAGAVSLRASLRIENAFRGSPRVVRARCLATLARRHPRALMLRVSRRDGYSGCTTRQLFSKIGLRIVLQNCLISGKAESEGFI